MNVLERLATDTADPELDALRQYDYESLFEVLETHRSSLDATRLGRLEWQFLPALGYSPSVPVLFEELAKDPKFFVEVISTVYRRHDGEEDAENMQEPANRETMAMNGYRLLEAWDVPPGFDGNAMDAKALATWLEEATPLLHERDRYRSGLHQFGQVLASSPADPDGTWPGTAVREVIEAAETDAIASGLFLAIVNGRGVTTRALGEGGEQERKLVEKYSDLAQKLQDGSPKTARILRKVAKSYQSDARREDLEAESFLSGMDD
ncbi:hypothetical protein FHX74_002246 [Friedmanniella endophytica]|uniref:Uncharacterized protein n=2 Tax=Microlunatus kandeliicorticis TaxID=1759536 RepID=A0A7W3ISW7_9ACTN|nr:hypothetical protein [Microlunatus kandeliicorticis]